MLAKSIALGSALLIISFSIYYYQSKSIEPCTSQRELNSAFQKEIAKLKN
ncbi:MAG: hypothetical protein HOO06_16370 [Bdellovibrionaceae bacterium]|jgi:hypothetical protein|nr:hypothetical protein [Pseudobdellovibrionaceae bacterium]